MSPAGRRRVLLLSLGLAVLGGVARLVTMAMQDAPQPADPIALPPATQALQHSPRSASVPGTGNRIAEHDVPSSAPAALLTCDLSRWIGGAEIVAIKTWSFPTPPPEDAWVEGGVLKLPLSMRGAGSATVSVRDVGLFKITWEAARAGADALACSEAAWEQGLTGATVTLEGVPIPDAAVVGCGRPVPTEMSQELFITMPTQPCSLRVRVLAHGMELSSDAVQVQPTDGQDLVVTLQYPSGQHWTPISEEELERLQAGRRRHAELCSDKALSVLEPAFREEMRADCASMRAEIDRELGPAESP